jgi:prevent-host-death family protein
MQTIKASEFKAKCLHLMDLVNESNEEIIITKNGKPVSRLVPYRKQVDSLFGLHKDTLKSHDDLIASTGEDWSADQ